jgi:hypothetical protein
MDSPVDGTSLTTCVVFTTTPLPRDLALQNTLPLAFPLLKRKRQADASGESLVHLVRRQ